MARIKKGPEGIAANRPQVVPVMGPVLEAGGNGPAHPIVDGGFLGDTGQLVAEVVKVVGTDLRNPATVSGQAADVAGDLDKLLRHDGALRCGDDKIIVPRRSGSVNALHEQSRKYANAGIAIWVGNYGVSSDVGEIDGWFQDAADVTARIDAAKATIAAEEEKATNAKVTQIDLECRKWSHWHKIACDVVDNWEMYGAIAEKYGTSSEQAHQAGSDKELIHGRLEKARADKEAAGKAIVEAKQRRQEAEGVVKNTKVPSTTLRLGYDHILVEKDGVLSLYEGSLSTGDLGNGARIVSPRDLPLDPPPIAPLPAWVTEAWWGEDNRSVGFDNPKAVTAAKRFLAKADRETDGPHRIAKELAKIKRELSDNDLENRYRQDLEQQRDALEEEDPYYGTTREVASKLIDHGLSKVRAQTLMRIIWNPRNRPQLSDETIRAMADEAWLTETDCVAREWRWQFRDPKEAGSVDDLLYGEVVEKDWLLGQIMAAGSRTMLYGPTGKGKTMTCMASRPGSTSCTGRAPSVRARSSMSTATCPTMTCGCGFGRNMRGWASRISRGSNCSAMRRSSSPSSTPRRASGSSMPS
jgi:hypothetical protein